MSTEPNSSQPHHQGDDASLALVLESSDHEPVKAFFRGMPEQRRRSYARQVAAWYKQVRTAEVITTPRGNFATRKLSASASAALMCVGSYSDLSNAPIWLVPHGNNAYDILTDRRPEWLAQWAEHLLSDENYWHDWRLVRRLAREGLIPKPDHPHYVLGMISGVGQWVDGTRPTVKQWLDQDPELLEDEVWKLFELEGGGENSLANVDRFAGGGWSATLLEYAETGKLSRARLLASCIAALQRDFNHYRAKWFASFYDRLKPSAQENHGNAQAFLGLLGVSAPNVVSWAFKKVQAQAKAKSYHPPELVAGLTPALEARSKGLVKSALKLLSTTAKATPQLHGEIVQAACIALAHEDVEVQAAALTLVEGCAASRSAEQLSALSSHLEMLAPSLRGRAQALLGDASSQPAGAAAAVERAPASPVDLAEVAPALQRLFAIDRLLIQPEAELWTLPAAAFDGTELPRLAQLEAIAPITDLEQLLDVAARVLEDAVGPDDVERVLDAVSRLADQRPDDFERRTAPLIKRAEQLFKRNLAPFVGDGPAADVAGLLYAWVTGKAASLRLQTVEHRNSVELLVVDLGALELTSYAGNTEQILGLLSRRVHQLSKRVAKGQAAPLLSAPSHAGGFLDPRFLAARVAESLRAAPPPPTLDVAVALLRLAPEHRTEALEVLDQARLADDSEVEWRLAVRHALGGEVNVAERAKSVALWAAAARARAPWRADPVVSKAFPQAGPDVGEPAVYELSFKTDKHGHVSLAFSDAVRVRGLDPDCIPMVLHTERGESMWARQSLGTSSDAGIRWAATLWPLGRESFFAAGLTQIAHNIDWWEARWASKTLLEPLLDPGTPLREMGLLLLATALGAKEPGEYGLGIDAAISAISDGRLGSDNLGRALKVLLESGMIKSGRWAKTLSDVSRASDAHAACVKLALEPCLALLEQPPRDFSKLLELLHELCVQLKHGVVGEQRAHLERVKGSNKVAKLAKAILAVPVDSSQQMAAALRSLTEMRISAARRASAEH